MKIIISIVLTMIAISANGQNKKTIYVDDKKDYVVFIENGIKLADKSISSTEVDTFVSADDKFQYTILISKIFEHDFIDGDLLADDYEKYYKSTCGCEILDGEIVIYNNIKSLRFKIQVERDGNKFTGYNDSFVSNGLLYNILFLSYTKDFLTFEHEYSDFMNTMIINGKHTIDSYNEYKE